ncbi:hypothetical protein CVT26_014738 [Gymnopilus dilepis]|uniref:Spc7 kinetochore protein domain-containing protein n=1 Tax=Gymnopilus dilepis TaxID=231916 RepID=A0A409W3Q1_9AGAR|nr:hypothetical protein CVT26_014738 [Gymnopilus dilepis]
MASGKKTSPNRRKSVAVVQHSRHSIVPKGRRRAHSIVPGASLSPLAKLRRALAPRKSILKTSINNLNTNSASQSTAQSQGSSPDDGDMTQSMEITQDFTSNNMSRKSLSRRVSWHHDTFVRWFDPKRGTGSDSSPTSQRSEDSPESRPVSDENENPGNAPRRRRSSARYSMAQSEDMDLTSVAPSTFAARGSAILDEDDEFEYGSEEEIDGDDMDVTQVIKGTLARRRTLSMGGRRRDTLSHEADESRSDIGNDSILSEGVSDLSDRSQIMDFTVPLGESLRPASQDQAWLALKQITHSGDEPAEPEVSSEDDAHDDMELGDAMARLKRARDSLSLPQRFDTDQNDDSQEDSITSTEDSFNDDDIDDGNKTLNLSKVIGRVSLGPDSRLSLGQDSNMDESEVYGNIVASTPRPSLVPPRSPGPQQEVYEEPSSSQPLRASVFQRPAEQDARNTPTSQQTAKPPSRPSSPSKSSGAQAGTPNSKPRPSFTAAFAPPVARPSPKKASSTTSDSRSPAKRPRSSHHDENIDSDRPSPAKRQALASKWQDVAEKTTDTSPTTTRESAAKTASSIPRPLSPSKKAPFQAPAPEKSETSTSTSRPSALRRPSGYFARRKSLAVPSGSSSKNDENVLTHATETSTQKKKPGLTSGRVSLGSGSADAWTRFNKDAGSGFKDKAQVNGNPAKEAPSTKAKEKEPVRFVLEATGELEPPSSPLRASPLPRKIVPNEPSDMEIEEPEPVQNLPIGRLSTISEGPEVIDVSTNMEVDVDATRQWREGVQQAAYEEEEEEEVPSISIAQFFAMTNVKFMDELTAPRRSMHPAQQAVRQPRNPGDIPLAEYVTAMGIDIPQLDLYSRVSKDLEAWMAKSKIVLAQAEEEAAKVTPELFVEYARADDEGRTELLHQLNLIRTHTRYLAKSDWYDWKLQWVEGLRHTADEAFAALEADARALEEPKKSAAAIIPALEQEYEEVMRELQQEQAEVAEIEGSDQTYLNDLKGTIEEQNIAIQELKDEHAECTDQLRWLQERMDEIEVQRREAKNTITTAQRILHMKQTSTRAEVFRLKGELEALEDLHMCRITKVHADLFEYVYGSQFQVSIPCKNFVPVVSKVTITRCGKLNTRYKDDFPRLSTFLMNAAQRLISEGDDLTVREIVHKLSDYWSSCAQLRSQLRLLSIKYPVEVILSPSSKESPSPSFVAKSMVMFPPVQSKAFISFKFSMDTFSQWPMAIDSLDCDVEVAYGSVDRSDILKAVTSRLSEATPADNYACLLDACIEAQELYH